MEKVFVIIVTYNGMKWLRKCLQSLRDSSYPLNIVVVDNNSNDGTVNFLKGQKDIYLILNNCNKGFGQANNQGIYFAQSKGADYYFLINQDVYIYPNTVQKLIQSSKFNKNVGIISPFHLNGNATQIDKYFLRAVLPTNEEIISDIVLKKMKRYYIVDNVPAAGWFLPQNTIKLIGGFDPIFYHYCEDDHYLQRLRYHKMTVMLDTESYINHDREGTIGNIKVYIRKKRRRDLILLVSDINLNASTIIRKISKNFIEFSFLNLFYIFSGKWNMVWNFIADYIYILFKTPIIFKSRKYNKIKRENWLK